MNGVSKLTVTEDVTLMSFEGLPADGKTISLLLSALAQHGINIDMISQSTPCSHQVGLSLTIEDRALVEALKICSDLGRLHEGLKPLASSSNCKIQLYGEEMRKTPGVASEAISAISETGTEIQLITTSEVDISCLVPGVNTEDALRALKAKFSL